MLVPVTYLEKKPTTYLNIRTAPCPINWINLGKVTPVQDQGSCGSCWAFSTVSALESAYAVQYGTLYKFSEQQVVDCSHEGTNAGCGGGLTYDAYDYF